MKEGFFIQDLEDLLEPAFKIIGSLPETKTGQGLIPEWNTDSPTDSRRVGEVRGDSISKSISQGKRNRNPETALFHIRQWVNLGV